MEHEGENWKKPEKRRKEKGKIGKKQGESRSGSTNSASAQSVACVFHVGLGSKKHKNNEDAIVAFLAGRTERGEGRGVFQGTRQWKFQGEHQWMGPSQFSTNSAQSCQSQDLEIGVMSLLMGCTNLYSAARARIDARDFQLLSSTVSTGVW